MDYKEEQSQELEILESIYPDELQLLNDTKTRFSINIALDTESETNHAVKLEVVYPETYPDVVPELDIVEGECDNSHLRIDYFAQDKEQDEQDEEEDDNFAGSKKLVNLVERIRFNRADYLKLLGMLKIEAEENIGMPSIFSLASSLKDHAEELFIEKFEFEEGQILKAREEREVLEQAKFNGTKVTTESFNKWRLTFRKEFGMDKRLNERYKEMHDGKLTGKEIWDRGLASGVDNDDNDDDVDGKDVDFLALRKKMKEIEIQ